MSTPDKPERFKEETTFRAETVPRVIAGIVGVKDHSAIKSWAIIVHVHNDEEHTTRIATSSQNDEAVLSLIMQGVAAL